MTSGCAHNPNATVRGTVQCSGYIVHTVLPPENNRSDCLGTLTTSRHTPCSDLMNKEVVVADTLGRSAEMQAWAS